MALATVEGRWVWVSADVRRCFDAIPLGRLLQACGHYLPQNVVGFVRRIADTGRRRGIRQGSPASPLLANIFLHFFVERRWYGDQAGEPLLRYADNFLVPCRTRDEAARAYERLTRLAREGGRR